MKILVLNSGSSSLKYHLIDSDSEEVLAKGLPSDLACRRAGAMIKHDTNSIEPIEVDVEMPNHEKSTGMWCSSF